SAGTIVLDTYYLAGFSQAYDRALQECGFGTPTQASAQVYVPSPTGPPAAFVTLFAIAAVLVGAVMLTLRTPTPAIQKASAPDHGDPTSTLHDETSAMSSHDATPELETTKTSDITLAQTTPHPTTSNAVLVPAPAAPVPDIPRTQSPQRMQLKLSRAQRSGVM